LPTEKEDQQVLEQSTWSQRGHSTLTPKVLRCLSLHSCWCGPWLQTNNLSHYSISS